MNFHKNASKQQKRIVLQYVVHFVEKKSFLLKFIPFYWFDQKQLFKQMQIFLRICPFQTWWEKQSFWVFQCLFLR